MVDRGEYCKFVASDFCAMRKLIYIVIVMVVTGCSLSGNHSGALDEAQRLMSSDPETALSKLNAIDVSEFRDSATMAKWALLYSEAMVANKLSAPTDTIINIAIEYYASHNLRDELQKASDLKTFKPNVDNYDALATALYLQKEKEFFLYKERARRELYMAVCIIIVILAAGVLMWMCQKMKLQRIKNDMLMAEASSLNNRIDAGRSELNRLETKLHGMLHNRFALIDSLCQTYYETQGTKTERKAIIDKVKSEIEAVRTVSFPEMEQIVNDCRDNILVRVKETFPNIKTEDYQLLVYLASGLSSRTISLLLEESVDVIYKRKSRLKLRLKQNLEPSLPEIMTIF